MVKLKNREVKSFVQSHTAPRHAERNKTHGCQLVWAPTRIVFEHQIELYSIYEFMVDSSPGEMGVGAGGDRRREKHLTAERQQST